MRCRTSDVVSVSATNTLRDTDSFAINELTRGRTYEGMLVNGGKRGRSSVKEEKALRLKQSGVLERETLRKQHTAITFLYAILDVFCSNFIYKLIPLFYRDLRSSLPFNFPVIFPHLSSSP
ncbi:hypothetical protein L1987_16205 [Smallanthus sonchifolius]|uniref:Uncharacterized protein n=1 Tax=Smallanthus sonchifolius TaxID=185202 RepID=A0ACB9J9T8_9ASTR|nr:hypothetical protein L1987_16205 [Smallanthus sonchifolius]